jgi:DNA-binding NtrC family response regulator
LIRHVLAEICAAREKPVPRVEPELMDCLVEYSWPGNGRQLRHCLETMLPERGADVLKRIHVPLSLVDLLGSSRTLASRRSVDTLADLERAAVARALEIHRGNRTRAAKVLGISVRTLQRKLRQWDRASNSRKTP